MSNKNLSILDTFPKLSTNLYLKNKQNSNFMLLLQIYTLEKIEKKRIASLYKQLLFPINQRHNYTQCITVAREDLSF